MIAINWRTVVFFNFMFFLLFFSMYMPVSSIFKVGALCFFEITYLLSIALIPFYVIVVSVLDMFFLRKKKLYTTRATLYGLPLTLIICIFTTNLKIFPKIDRAITILQGNRIVNALENYKNDHALYPASLKELTPNYLKKLPHSKIPAVSDFEYRRYGEIYILKFEVMSAFWEYYKVEYSPWDNLSEDGIGLKETGFTHWKYLDYFDD